MEAVSDVTEYRLSVRKALLAYKERNSPESKQLLQTVLIQRIVAETPPKNLLGKHPIEGDLQFHCGNDIKFEIPIVLQLSSMDRKPSKGWTTHQHVLRRCRRTGISVRFERYQCSTWKRPNDTPLVKVKRNQQVLLMINTPYWISMATATPLQRIVFVAKAFQVSISCSFLSEAMIFDDAARGLAAFDNLTSAYQPSLGDELARAEATGFQQNAGCVSASSFHDQAEDAQPGALFSDANVGCASELASLGGFASSAAGSDIASPPLPPTPKIAASSKCNSCGGFMVRLIEAVFSSGNRFIWVLLLLLLIAACFCLGSSVISFAICLGARRVLNSS